MDDVLDERFRPPGGGGGREIPSGVLRFPSLAGIAGQE